jgi:methyl-accepting chemotaxis protein
LKISLFFFYGIVVNILNVLDFLSNIRIGPRLFGGFIIVTLLMGLVGVVGFIGMNSISAGMDKVYSDGTLPLLEVSEIETSLNSIRALVFRIFAIPAERTQDAQRMSDEMKVVDEHIKKLKSASLSPGVQDNLKTFERQWENYKAAATGVSSLLAGGKVNEALISISNGGDHANARRATVDTFERLKTGILQNAEQIALEGQAEKDRTVPVMLALGIFSVLIALGFAIGVTRSITIPLRQVMDQFEQMGRGVVSGRLKLDRRDEVGEMAGTFDRFSDYLEHDVVGTMHQIAAGDLSADLTARGEDDQITPALNETLASLKSVISELQNLSDRASAGDLTVRGDPGDLAGSYREIIIGFNATLEALINPLNGAIRLSKNYADCDFTARFPHEIAVMGDFLAFRQALDAIGSEVSKALGIVNRQMHDLEINAEKATVGIDDVRRGAGIIAANADQTRNNAEQSEEGISQVLRAMEDLTSTVASVSSNVDAVARAGAEADELARNGMDSAAHAEDGMMKIKRSSNEVEVVIKDIQSQMNEITKIIGIITDISEQTNLLALNAAIEAARAGDAGLGFAVVAGEVKALANQTGESAQKIAMMISGLESQSGKAVAAMEQAGNAVDQGEKAVQETIKAFTDLTRSVSEISYNMTSVAGATEEQAASFEEITASINEMSGLVKNTAKDALNSSATAEEALTVVEQITTIISEINEVVSVTNDEMKRFKI